MGTVKLQRIFRFRTSAHMLPTEQGRHLRLPSHRHACKLSIQAPWGDERHLLLECPALAGVRSQSSRMLRYHGQACLVQRPANGQQVHFSVPWYGVMPRTHIRYSIQSALLAAKNE